MDLGRHAIPGPAAVSNHRIKEDPLDYDEDEHCRPEDYVKQGPLLVRHRPCYVEGRLGMVRGATEEQQEAEGGEGYQRSSEGRSPGHHMRPLSKMFVTGRRVMLNVPRESHRGV